MITVNDISFPWEEGMTIADCVALAAAHPDLKLIHGKNLIYLLNGRSLSANSAAKTKVNENDNVQLLLIVAGG